MDTSAEDVEESMLDLVLRAEAFLAAHPLDTSSSSGASSSSSSSSSTSTEPFPEDSFATAAGSSHNSSGRTSYSDFSNASVLSISGPSSSGHNYDSDEGSSRSADQSGINSSLSSGHSSDISGISSNSRNSVRLDLSTDEEADSFEVSLPGPRVQRTVSDDCILVPLAVPFIDLCTPRNQRDLLRRIASSAPIVDSITLDDTINEPLAIPGSIPQPQPQPVVSVFPDAPPAKRPKEVPAPAALDMSHCSAAEPRPMDCPICYDSIFRKQAASTICGHLFCNACIKQEIKIRRQCPLCKRSLTAKNIHPIYFN